MIIGFSISIGFCAAYPTTMDQNPSSAVAIDVCFPSIVSMKYLCSKNVRFPSYLIQ
ncbi:MAG: hypothetical protein ACFFKA_01350 [Candidatus Thorarchaeota archaeon]